MLSFIYNYVDDERYINVRDINMRRREGMIFNLYKHVHYKSRQDPLMKAMEAWNYLPVHTRNSITKEDLKTELNNSILNPYKINLSHLYV